VSTGRFTHITITDPSDNKTRMVGHLVGRTFVKEMEDAHFLQKPPAIAIQDEALAEVVALGGNQVVIVRRSDGTVFFSPLARFREKGFSFDRGHGGQTGLALTYWDTLEPTLEVLRTSTRRKLLTTKPPTMRGRSGTTKTKATGSKPSSKKLANSRKRSTVSTNTRRK
jgi:hypothetical protein